MLLKCVNRNVSKYTFWHERPTKTLISLRIYAVRSESSLSTWRNVASLAIQNASSEDFDQPAHAQAAQNLRWAHMSKGMLSDERLVC